MQRRHVVLVFLIGLMVVSTGWVASASVAPIPLSDLAKSSDCITVARVENVKQVQGVRIASVLTEKVWKGQLQARRIYVVAESTWTCDTSDAIAGERVLLFLDKTKNSVVDRSGAKKPKPPVRLKLSPLFSIAHSGRGRMPLRILKGKEYVTLWTSGVILPANIKTINGPEANYSDFIRSALLNDLIPSFAPKAGSQPSVH